MSVRAPGHEAFAETPPTAAADGETGTPASAPPPLGASWTPRRPPAPPLPPSAAAGAADGNTLLLGLYLLLLAFFVMLTALSQREEERIRTVLASLHSAFAAHAPRPEALPFDTGTDRVLAGAELERLERLFAADLPLHTAAIERTGDRLRLRLETGAVFAPGSTAPRRSRRLLLARLAAALASPPAGLRTEAVATVGSRDIAQTADAVRVAGERADALGRALTGFGAPAARFVVGIGEAAPDQVVVALIVRPAPASGLDDGDR